MIRYFVSYVHGFPGTWGYGWTDATVTVPISSPADVHRLTAAIQKRGAANVTILGWQRFEDEQTGERQ